MKTYKLAKDKYTGEIKDFAFEIVDGEPTGVCVNIHTNQVFLAWIKDGGELQDADGVVMSDAQEFVRGLP